MNTENKRNSEEVEKYEFPEGSISNFGKKKNIVLSSFTLAVIIIIAVIFAFYAAQETNAGDQVKKATGWDVLRIDGNRNGIFVDFNHEAHQNLLGTDKEGCRNCHHLSKPDDGPSSCSQCHSNMEKPASIFDHNYHNKLFADQNSCRQCHADSDKESDSKCSTCHEDYTKDNKFYLSVLSYKEAMQIRCTGCHKAEGENMDIKMLNECTFCHSSEL